MRKKTFAHSWGRKMFYGIGWGLTSIVALNYFQSMILPQTFTGWIYFLTTFIGHYGLLISVLYFLFYWPVTFIFPSYYISRIWLIILLASLNTFIFVDSFLFSKYRFHTNSFLASFLQSDLSAFGFSSVKWVLLASGVLTFVIVLWVRGERLWRYMQSRFSNPVKNWYLAVIGISLLISHGMFLYSDATGATAYQKLSQLFPLHFPLTGKSMLKSQGLLPDQKPEGKLGYKDFYYPNKKLNCAIKNPKNVLFIVIENFGSEINEINYPHLSHYKNHGSSFSAHYSGGNTPAEGLFSLLYSLPPVYVGSAFHANQEPAFLSVLRASKFDVDFYSSDRSSPLRKWLSIDEKSVDSIPSEIAVRDELTTVNPFFMYAYLNRAPAENDAVIAEVLESFYKHGLVSNTIVIIAGATGEKGLVGPEALKSNLVVIWPGKARGIVSHQTSHYDILPALMQDEWKCSNAISDYSFGENLFRPKTNTMHVAGTYDNLNIINFNNLSVVDIDQFKGLSVRSLPELTPAPDKLQSTELLKALEQLTLFYKRR